MKPTIAIIGAGAVGLYYGGRLAAAGLPVHFLLRSDYEAISTGGLRVRSCDGDFHLPPAAFGAHRSVDTMPAADVVLVALKSTSNHLYESLLRPVVKSDTAIVTLQNGLGNEDSLAALFGARRVFGGIAFTCINREPGPDARAVAEADLERAVQRAGRGAGPGDG
jgi:2-dehydropantoate 2-reductase